MLKYIERETAFEIQERFEELGIKRDQIVQITETEKLITLWYWED